MTSEALQWVAGDVAIDLTEGVASPEGWTVRVLDEGTGWGEPSDTGAAELVAALLAGDEWTLTGERVVPLRLQLEAPDSLALARGERALDLMRVRGSLLRWTPPDGVAPETVWTVVRAERRQVFDSGWSVAELQGRRYYEFTLTCESYASSAASLSVSAVVDETTGTLVDACSSTTGWSSPDGSPSVVSGRVRVTTSGPGYITLVRTGAIDPADGVYLTVDWLCSAAAYYSWALNGSGALLVEVRRDDLGGGLNRSWLQIKDSSSVGVYNTLSLSVAHGWEGTQYLEIDQVRQWPMLDGFGSLRQMAMAVPVDASVRSPGTVRVEHESAALGDVIVYSSPAGSGFTPPLRRWRTSSDTPSSDATAVSGYANGLAGVTNFTVPAGIVPRGEATMWARMKFSTATKTRIHFSADAWLGSTLVGAAQAAYVDVTPAAGDTWYVVPLGLLTMPPTEVGPAGSIRLAMQRDAGSGVTVTLDEAWLFPRQDSRLTVVSCGTGTPTAGAAGSRLRIEPPTTDTPARVMLGTLSDYSDAYGVPGARQASPEWHVLTPGVTSMFVVTTGADAPEVTVDHVPRWHTHAAV